MFEQLSAKYPQLRFAWVDVEDREDIMDDVDVETFPTVMLSKAREALFLGPVLPQIGVLQRMVEPGQIVSPGSGALYRVAAGGQLVIKEPQNGLVVVRNIRSQYVYQCCHARLRQSKNTPLQRAK